MLQNNINFRVMFLTLSEKNLSTIIYWFLQTSNFCFVFGCLTVNWNIVNRFYENRTGLVCGYVSSNRWLVFPVLISEFEDFKPIYLFIYLSSAPFRYSWIDYLSVFLFSVLILFVLRALGRSLPIWIGLLHLTNLVYIDDIKRDHLIFFTNKHNNKWALIYHK